jgi:hypothetical protein
MAGAGSRELIWKSLRCGCDVYVYFNEVAVTVMRREDAEIEG